MLDVVSSWAFWPLSMSLLQSLVVCAMSNFSCDKLKNLLHVLSAIVQRDVHCRGIRHTNEFVLES